MKLPLIISLLFFVNSVNAKSYYISEKGNDANDGVTPATAWQTIGKINNFTFAANDSILFKRGETFYGEVIVRRSNLFFGAFGTGSKPIISGLSTVTGWVNLGGNIWEASVSNVKRGVNLVLRDGKIQQVGRYPNSDAVNGGYLTLTAATNTTITGPALSTTTNWTGAELAIKVRRWDIRRQIVTAHSGGILTFTSGADVATVGYGYFFQRDPRTLDQLGEWWHDATNNKLRMYFPANNPTSYNIQISSVDTLIYNFGNSNITIDNLAIIGANSNGIWNEGCSNIIVRNCDLNTSGREAITGWYVTNMTVDNCTAKNSLGSGIYLRNTNTGTNNQIVTNCNADSTAMIAGMEVSTIGHGRSGITAIGNGVGIYNNIVTNSGYNGIEWQGNDVYIKYNFINNYALVRDDCGGIYTYETNGTNLPVRTNRNLISNIIMNGIGNNYGTNNATAKKANGLYCDEGSRTIIIDSNSVTNENGAGIICNSFTDIKMRYNTLYNNMYSHLFERFQGANPIRNISFKKNKIYPYKFSYTNLQIEIPTLITIDQDVAAAGTLDSNYCYISPGSDSSLFWISAQTGVTKYQSGYRTFPYIKGTITQEIHSTIINPSNAASRFEYNATNVTKTITLDAKYIGADSTVYNGTITLQPFTSAILIRSGIIDAALKADAGTDISLVLPTNTTVLKGSANGTVVTYNWTKIAGPNQFTIANPANPSTAINNLASGKYTFQLKVINSAGDSAFATTNVVVLGVLPVTLINFSAKNINDKVELDWLVASEINVSHYSIEKSGNGLDFENIGQVNANNLFNVQTNYKYNDSFPAQGTNYYRLAMIDNDGTTKYSKIISADVKNASASKLENLSLSISKTNIKIGITSNSQQVMHLVVADVSGRILFTNPIQLQKGFNAIDKRIPTLNTGIYYAKLFTRDQLITRAILSGR